MFRPLGKLFRIGTATEYFLFQHLGTALRVFNEIFVTSTWPLFTKSLMECSATRSFYIIVSSLRLYRLAPDFHLPFFNLRARRFVGRNKSYYLVQAPLNVANWGEWNPSPSFWNIHPSADPS